jgi:pSer/pThr/pTyr-binding forkhead associated (FHA) protein
VSRRLIILGGKKPRELALVGTMVVGRDPMCDVSESDPLLSRRHAEFVSGAKDVTVRDLGSRNGILINGVKRPQAILHGGDVVQVGHLQVKFLDEAGPALERAEAEFEATAVVTPQKMAAVPETVTAPIVNPPTVRLPEAPPASNGTAGAVRPAPMAAADSELDRTLPTVRAPQSDDPDRTVPTVRRPGSPASPAPNEMWDASPVDVQTFVGPGDRIRFDMPKRDWQVVSGGAAAIVSLAHRSGQASVVVERATPGGKFATLDLSDRFAEREADTVRTHQPGAADVEAKLVALGTRRLLIVTYSRKGVAGPERVRQYSIPAGSDLYRLTCSAATSQFARFEPVFAHVAATFATGTKS